MASTVINWGEVVGEIRASGMTLDDIAKATGYRSVSSICELQTKCVKEPPHSRGEALLKLRSRVRLKSKQIGANAAANAEQKQV